MAELAGGSCSFKTVELPNEHANEQLKSHIAIVHQATSSQVQVRNGQQGERVKRPILSMSGNTMEQADLDHFAMLYTHYKQRLVHSEEDDTAPLLFECLNPEVTKILHDACGDSLKGLGEKDLFVQIKTCCVLKRTRQAIVMELFRTKQEPGQNVQTFLATLKAKSRQCGFKKTVKT